MDFYMDFGQVGSWIDTLEHLFSTAVPVCRRLNSSGVCFLYGRFVATCCSTKCPSREDVYLMGRGVKMSGLMLRVEYC